MADEIRLDVSANTTPMERDIAEARRRVGTITLNANMDSRGMENFNRSLGKITGQADEFSKSMEAANARVLAFGASVGVINAISNAFKNLVSSTVEVEKSLTEIKIIGNETFSDLNRTSAGLFGIAKQLGVSYKDAADSTLEFARQGKDLTASLDASRAALALTRTAGIAATDAVMGLTSAVNAFGRGADAYIEYANKMSAVSDSFAVNNKDLIEGISRSASVAQEAGVSFEQLTAFITTLQEKTGRGGAVIGNALKTIFTRVQNPEIIKDLRDLGISVQDATTGSFLPATQIIQNLANEFQGFDKNLRNSVLLKVGGGFQVDKLAALLNDVKSASGTFQSSLNIATSGSGNILGKVAQLNQTVDSSFTNVLTSSKQLGSNIGQIAFSKDFSNILQNGASAITSINEAIFGNGGKDAEDQGSSIGKAVLKGIGSIVSGPGLALFIGILGKLSLDFAKFSASGLQALLGITSKSKEEQLIQTAITNVLSRNADFQQQIFNLEGNRVAQANLLLGVIRQQVNEAAKLEKITGEISPILRQAGFSVSRGTPQITSSPIGSAKGYIPNLAETIAKERSESPSGSKIIVDNNFPMGGGQRSTMVYNSNETRIPNFRGSGGDAIIPNYPVNSAKGYTPNFAESTKPVLNIDARAASIAGITLAGEGASVLDKAKPYPLTPKNLKKYAGSNLLDTLQQYGTFNVTNLPVGHAYRFRKGLQGSEDQIKSDFISKINSRFRSEIVKFVLEEVSGLGLKPGGGLASNLSNIKLDVIGTSTAGYLFEELLKIPTLTDAEKVAQYSSQSSTEFFDMKNLEPSFAEAYGLPKRKFDLAEIKLGEGELKDGIAKKLLNQIVTEGGGANPKRFGARGAFKASSGYVPNFALIKNLAKIKDIGASYLPSHYDVNNKINNVLYNDKYKGNAKIKKFKLDRSLESYTKEIESLLENFKNTGERTKLDYLKNNYTGKSFDGYKTAKTEDSKKGYINVLKGALGEDEVFKSLKTYTRETNNFAGIDFYNSDRSKLVEIKTKEKILTQDEANAKVLTFLGTKAPLKGNEISDERDLSAVDFNSYEVQRPKTKYLNAAGGYIPNFASSVEDAINREKIATGLPDSMIKVSKDSRAKNSSFNPYGTIVTNKVDEPRGGMDVPNSRMINAYNSSKGFIPNFAEDTKLVQVFKTKASGDVAKENEQIQTELGSGGKFSSSITEASTSLKTFADKVQDTSSKVTVGLDDFYNSLKESIKNSPILNTAAKNKAIAYIDKNEINPSDTGLSGKLQTASGGKGANNKFTSILEQASAQAQAMATEKVAKASVEKKLADDLAKKEKDRNDTADQLNNLLKEELKISKKHPDLQNNLNKFLNERKDLLLNLNRLTRDEISSLAETIAGKSGAGIRQKTAESALFSVRDSLKESTSKQTTQREILQVPKKEESQNKEQQESTKKATKSLGDLAQTAFIFQSGLSFATGALSTLGKEFEAFGDVVNSIGQIGYTVMQGGDLFKQLTKGRGPGELISSIGTGARTGAAAAGGGIMSRLGGGIRGAFVGTAAVEGGAAATGLGAGSGAAALMASGALAAGVAAGGYLLYKSVDSIGKLMSGAATRTERAVNAFNDIQEKYNVQLSDKQRVTVDRLSELADVSGTSLSGAATGSGYTLSQGFRSFKATLGFKDETYKNTLQQQIAKSGLNLDAEGNQALAKSLGPLLAPIVTEATNKRGENGLIITAPQGEQDRRIAELFGQKLKRIDEILKQELKKPENFNFSTEEIEKIIEEKKLKNINQIEQTGTDLSTRRTVTVTAKEQAITELKKRKESDLTGVAAARAAQETAPESIAAQATLEAQKQGILIQTELLKKRLEITQQIAKIEGTIPSALESSLSIQKELLSTNEGTKFALDLQLKNLQEERQVRSEIKDLFSTEARDIISKNLEKTASLGVTAPRTKEITGLFNNLQYAQTVEDQKKAYSEIVNQLDLSVSRQLVRIDLLKGENEELEMSGMVVDDIIAKNNEEIKQLSVVNEQLQQRTALLQGSLDVINKQSQARKIQTAQSAQERAITEKSNYYYTLQKDIFSAQIEIQNKKLEKAKQELDLRKQMRDLSFEEMQFADKTKTEPRKQYEAGMFAAQSKETDTLTDVRTRNADKAQAYRQSLYNDISSRTNNLQTMSDASKAATSGNTKELERLFSQAFGEQAQTFDQKVLSAANQFAQIVVQSAKDSEAIKKGEKPSTSYQAVSTSSKSVEDLMSQSYGFKNQDDIIKNIQELKNRRQEVDFTEIFPEDVDKKVKELQDLLTSIKEQAAEAKRQSLIPVTEDESQIAKNAKRRKDLEQGRLTQGESERTTFTGGFKSAKNDIDLQIETFNSRLGKDIPMAFRDSMVSAMRELSNPNSTQPLKERLLGVASAFLNKINEALMTQSANKITSSIMGFAGMASGMASGGYIKGGSGSKDDVPAMLMGGEYVVTKSAVQKYGPAFLDSLNKGTIKKYASGGWVESDVTKYQDPDKITPYGQRKDKGLSFDESGRVIGMDSYSGKSENKQDAMMRSQTDYYAANAQSLENGFYMPGQNGMGGIMGAKNLLSFATQQTTGTRFDKISGRGTAASIDIGAGSSNLSLFALRDQDNLRNKEYLESKEKSLSLYFGSLDAAKEKATKEEEIRKEQERIKQEFEKQKKEARKQLIQGIVTSIASSAAMAGLSYAGNTMSAGMESAKQAAWQSGGKTGFMEGAFSGATINGETRGGLSNIFNSSGTQNFSNMVDTKGNFYQWDKLSKTYFGQGADSYNKAFPTGANYSSSPNKIGNYFPQRKAAGGFVAGNGMGDNVPTMLNGGEFVVSKQAAQNVGINKLQQINSGNTGNDSSEIITAKLDELVEKLSAVGTINITVNSDGKGGNQTKEDESQNSDKQQKELARRIKDVVLGVLREEKRLGGLLR